jgi:hypothetical protein
MRALGLALALVAAVGAGAGARPVEVEVRGMRLDPVTGSPVVQLVEKNGAGARELLIWIGPFEAQAIVMEMRGVPSPRPMTHDLMRNLVERLGARLRRVVIEDVRDNTYLATIHLRRAPGEELTVDARPSDAIALALRLRGPILVAEELFAKAAALRPGPAAGRFWGVTVQDLTPETAAFFAGAPAAGVLVSDVPRAAPAHDLARGDVITALDGQPVASVDELARLAGARQGGPVRLSVRRDGRDVTVRFAAE